MINFVVCEDEKKLRTENINQIVSFMMNYDIDYKIHEFSNYDKKFENYAKKDDCFKIYLLDIVIDKNLNSGISAARKIREEYDDWNSIIIMLTSHQEYKYEVLSCRLYILDFINKLDNPMKKLKEDLLIALKAFDKRYKMLSYVYKNDYHNIELRHIICIEKEQDSKRCILKTKEGNIFIPGSLKDICKKLDNRFFRTHKSLVVNLDEISVYEVKKNKITFKNGENTYLIARNKKKELIERVSNG